MFYQLVQPAQWHAGITGEGPADEKPIYFDCGLCGAKEPPIAGFSGAGPTYQEIYIFRGPDGLYRHCMYCAECWDKVLHGAKAMPPEAVCA